MLAPRSCRMLVAGVLAALFLLSTVAGPASASRTATENELKTLNQALKDAPGAGNIPDLTLTNALISTKSKRWAAGTPQGGQPGEVPFEAALFVRVNPITTMAEPFWVFVSGGFDENGAGGCKIAPYSVLKDLLGKLTCPRKRRL